MLTRVVLLAGLSFALNQHPQGASVPPATPSPTPSVSPTPTAADLKIDRALFDRACDWWKARIARDHKAIFDLTDPAYRKNVKLEDFVVDSTRRARFDILSFRIDRARVVPEGVRLTIVTRANLIMAGIQDTSSEDLWIRVDGKWFKVWEPLLPPFPRS